MGFLHNGVTTAIENAIDQAQSAALACENIATGMNSMADIVTSTTYGFGVEDGAPYLEELEAE